MIDNVGPLKKGEVEVVQHLRPNGEERKMAVEVGVDVVKMAKDMVLTCEWLSINEVALYVRWKDSPNEDEMVDIAENGPGERSPVKVLKALIERKRGERK